MSSPQGAQRAEVEAEAGSSSDPPGGSWEGVGATGGVAVAPGIEASKRDGAVTLSVEGS